MKNRFKIIIFLSVMLCSLIAISISASAYETWGNYEYYVLNNTVTITGLVNETDFSGSQIIPETINGYPVTRIDSWAFYNCTSLTSVDIPDSVTNIGAQVFRNCTSLTSVEIPDSVTSIGNNAFQNCTSLTSVTIPDSVTSIDEKAFQNCTSLTRVHITDIAAWCRISFSGYYSNPLYYAKNLYLNGELVTSLVIPDIVTSIGNFAFYNRSSLTSVEIPDSVTSIGIFAFYNCTSLTSVTIPDSVTSIDRSAFSYCTSLRSVKIPDSVTSIGDSAFYNTAVYNDSSNWEYNALYIGNHLIKVKSSYYEGFAVKNGTKTIACSAFQSYTSLGNVTIPDSVTSIGSSAFSYCTSLRSVKIPDSVTSIGAQAFYECRSLTSVTIPDSVTIIGSSAFNRCTSLRSVTIPDSVASIGDYTFYNCTSLTSIRVDENNKYYSSVYGNLFNKDKTTLIQYAIGKNDTYYIIPDSVMSIGIEAFENCTSLRSVEIPDSVTSIGKYAFYNCTSLTDVYYGGIQEEWNKIIIDMYNESLTNATIHYLGVPADYTAVEEALAKVPADLTVYTDETAKAVTDAVNAVVYGLTVKDQETVDAYAQAIEDAVSKLTLKPVSEAIVLTDTMVNYRLRCTTKVVDGNLVLTADPAGAPSMKVRLGNLPAGAELMFAQSNANVSMASGIIAVKNPGLGRVEVPMMIISAEGIVTDFVLVADFGNAVRYATNARISQNGNNVTVTSGNATAYLLFDTTDIEGGYVEVTNASRNLLGRNVIVGTSAVRFYDPVYDEGTAIVNVKNADGEIVESYNVTMRFSSATEYTPILDSSLRCSYTVEGDTITVTADAGATNVYLILGRYYAESLSANVNDATVKKTGARTWRVMKSATPIEFDVYFDASAYGGEVIKKHFVVNF